MAVGDMQLTAVSGAGSQVFHAIRRGHDGSWTRFGDVGFHTRETSRTRDLAVAMNGPALHLTTSTVDGRLLHAVRQGNGTWTGVSNVEVHTQSEIGLAHAVAAAQLRTELHVATTTTDGRLFHAIRFADGRWTRFGDVEGRSGDMGALSDVAVSGIGHDLHLAAVNTAGRLFHTIRRGHDGSWTGFGDVERHASELGAVRRVAVAALGEQLHLVATNSAGGLHHTIRRADGSWTRFRDVEVLSGERGTIGMVALVRVGSEIHFAATGTGGRIWHGIRHADDSWTASGDVEAGSAGEIGVPVAIAVAAET